MSGPQLRFKKISIAAVLEADADFDAAVIRRTALIHSVAKEVHEATPDDLHVPIPNCDRNRTCFESHLPLRLESYFKALIFREMIEIQ